MLRHAVFGALLRLLAGEGLADVILRTPDERFDDLPDYPFAPHYVEVRTRRIEPVRMHYVDAGPVGRAGRRCFCTVNPRGRTCTGG